MAAQKRTPERAGMDVSPTGAPYQCTADELALLKAYRDLPRRERDQFHREILVRSLIWRCVIDDDGVVAPGPLGPRAPHRIEDESI